jgi:hypothetical protein
VSLFPSHTGTGSRLGWQPKDRTARPPWTRQGSDGLFTSEGRRKQAISVGRSAVDSLPESDQTPGSMSEVNCVPKGTQSSSLVVIQLALSVGSISELLVEVARLSILLKDPQRDPLVSH